MFEGFQLTEMFPLISDFTGLKAVGPSTSIVQSEGNYGTITGLFHKHAKCTKERNYFVSSQ